MTITPDRTSARLGKPVLVASLLSFVSGFVDTVGFVALFGLFTAHVTGNFVLFAASFIHPHAGFIAKLAALPVFIATIAAVTLFVGHRERTGRPALSAVILAQMALLAAFGAMGFAASPILDADAPWAVMAGLLGVSAMAVHNAASRLLLNELPPTTVMTGNVAQFAIDATRLLRLPRTIDNAATYSRFAKLGISVLAFTAGAIAGALGYRAMGFAALLTPIAALAAAMGLLRKPQAAGVGHV